MGGVPPFTYHWTGPAGFASSNKDITGLEPGTYSVTVTDGYGLQDHTEATINSGLEILVKAEITDVTCYGDKSGMIKVNPSGGTAPYGYQWNGPSGFVSSEQNINRLAAGTYTLTVIETMGCTVKDAIKIKQPEKLAIRQPVITHVGCINDNTGTIQIAEPTGGTPGYSYLWNNGATTRNISGLTAGTYTLTVTDANLCDTTIAITVKEGANLTEPVFSPVSPFCEGSIAPVLPKTSNNGFTGIWEPTNVNNMVSGKYVFTPDSRQCADTTSLWIIVNAKATATFDLPSGLCRGSSGIPLPATSLNNFTGTWNSDSIYTKFTSTYKFKPNPDQCAKDLFVTVSVITVAEPVLAVTHPTCDQPTGKSE